MPTIPTFTTAQLSLLATEQAAELAETALATTRHSPAALSRAGLALINLRPQARRTGMGGRSVVELGADGA
ncbi:hypothetical protein LTR28_000662, partial [Elasticomyces elasticus]